MQAPCKSRTWSARRGHGRRGVRRLIYIFQLHISGWAGASAGAEPPPSAASPGACGHAGRGTLFCAHGHWQAGALGMVDVGALGLHRCGGPGRGLAPHDAGPAAAGHWAERHGRARATLGIGIFDMMQPAGGGALGPSSGALGATELDTHTLYKTACPAWAHAPFSERMQPADVGGDSQLEPVPPQNPKTLKPFRSGGVGSRTGRGHAASPSSPGPISTWKWMPLQKKAGGTH